MNTKSLIKALTIILFFMTNKIYTQEINFSHLDSIIQKEMKVWNVPGLAITIVKNNKINYAKGFGYKDLNSKSLVDNKTIFPIASTTKSFTSTAIAKLLHENKLSWDTSINEIYPEFNLSDPFLSNKVTIRDILSHKVGLPGNDLIWYGNRIDENELLSKINLLEPTTSFRNSFQYNNLLYLLAGHLIHKISNFSYSEYLQQAILTPLKMTSTFSDYNSAVNTKNYAKPYALVDDSLIKVSHLDLNAVLPAGGIYSNVEDLSKWLMFLLDIESSNELDKGYIKETQIPQNLLPKDPFFDLLFPKSNLLSYGMGWIIHSYRGNKILEHTGNTDGYSTHLIMVPEANLGIAILTNLNANFYSFAIKNRIIDLIYSNENTDWNRHYSVGFKTFFDNLKKMKLDKSLNRKKRTKPSLELTKYKGVFSHPFYGDITININDKLLLIKFLNGIKGNAMHWHFDTFKIKWDNELLGESYLNFQLNASGEVESINIDQVGLFPLNETFKK